jgi:WD40 repeat protein
MWITANFSRLNGSMFVFSRMVFRSTFGFSALAATLIASMILHPRPCAAQGTHLWTQAQLEEFEKGTTQGVALTSDGHLRQGPGLTDVLTTPSTFVWSVAADKNGTVYLGTGSPATVLRAGTQKGEKPFTLFETRDLSVQVVRLGPDGALYAATLPSGKVYRLKADATAKQDESRATVVFDAAAVDAAADGNPGLEKADAKPHYIWDLTFDSAGRLYIATGDPGAVYRVDPAKSGATPEEFLKTDEAHIRSLAWDARGNLIAGSDGSGLVYRIDAQGKGFVLFEAPRREITSVAVSSDGTIYAASVGDKTHNPLPPLPVQGVGSVSITIVQPGSLQAVNSSSSVPEGTEIYALATGQAPRKLWSSKEDIVYALAARLDGLLALTGNRGHIYRIQPDGSYADIAHLDAQQGLSMAAVRDAEGMGGIFIGAGNTGRLFFLGAADKHEYASDVLDAGAMARFGRVEVQPGSSGYEIFTRSGNVEQPVRGWSDWEPLKDGSVASPAGRFLQWKAVLHTGGSVGSVAVNYLPVNAAPVVDEIVVVPGARLNPQNQAINQPPTVNISFASSAPSVNFDLSSSAPLQALKDRTSVTVRWAAHDDNGDDLVYSLYLRGDGETVWRLLKDKIAEKVYSFDSTLIPDGGYQIKVVASDAPSHTPADALTGEKITGRFMVDTAPPVITAFKAAGEAVDCEGSHCPRPFVVTFDAEDAASPIARAEYSLDAGPWQYVEPVGGLSDSRHEHYQFRISLDVQAGKMSEHLVTVRAYDRYENVGVAKTVIPAQEK